MPKEDYPNLWANLKYKPSEDRVVDIAHASGKQSALLLSEAYPFKHHSKWRAPPIMPPIEQC